LDIAGNETVLHSFTGPDWSGPFAGVVIDKAGNFYGTTTGGGSSGAGTVFKLDDRGHLTVLHSFGGSPDGADPVGDLVMDGAGNLYGTTAGGGSAGAGTVFKVDICGDETVLHNFTDVPDGAEPIESLTMDKRGNLYGTTQNGGAFGVGTVFELIRTDCNESHGFACDERRDSDSDEKRQPDCNERHHRAPEAAPVN
jgi:uncharacterized repeat protein (TIGR03803 family)